MAAPEDARSRHRLFCFFQQPIEWIRLLEKHPQQFDEAMGYEKISDDPGKTFTWIQGIPLKKLKEDPAVREAIIRRYVVENTTRVSGRVSTNRLNSATHPLSKASL